MQVQTNTPEYSVYFRAKLFWLRGAFQKRQCWSPHL